MNIQKSVRHYYSIIEELLQHNDTNDYFHYHMTNIFNNWLIYKISEHKKFPK